MGQEAGLDQDQVDTMYIHEVVLDGQLSRPLHHTEKLLDVTLRWVGIKSESFWVKLVQFVVHWPFDHWVVVGGTFDFRVTPNPNIMLDVNLDVEFDNYAYKV